MPNTITVEFLGETLTLEAHPDGACVPEVTYHALLLGSMFDLWPAYDDESKLVTVRWLGRIGTGTTIEDAVESLEIELKPIAKVLAPLATETP